MSIPSNLELEIAALEGEVGAAAFPDTRESVAERVRGELANSGLSAGEIEVRAAERWASRLSMLRLIKRDNPSLFDKMARGD